MRFVLKWSRGDYDDYRAFTVPFEYVSAEQLYLDIESMLREYKIFKKKDDELWKAYWVIPVGDPRKEEAFNVMADHEKNNFPKPIKDESGREIHVADLDTTDFSGIPTIWTIDEWFEKEQR